MSTRTAQKLKRLDQQLKNSKEKQMMQVLINDMPWTSILQQGNLFSLPSALQVTLTQEGFPQHVGHLLSHFRTDLSPRPRDLFLDFDLVGLYCGGDKIA